MDAKQANRLRIKARLRDDFTFFAPQLEIKTKAGGFQRLKLNNSQRELHCLVEDQRERMGWVRAIVLKGRQQGVSTYIGARGYWKTTHRKGYRTRIVAHNDDATAILFAMVRRFHDQIEPVIRASTSRTNAMELIFDKLGSGYRVNPAGGREIGRSDTVHFLHASEYAFWPNAEMHAAGLMQTVPLMPDTEVFKESTANGLGGAFHAEWVAAVKGESDDIAVFLPWYEHEEYERAPPTEWTPSPAWTQYAESYNLDRERLYWAFTKSRGLGQVDGFSPDEPCPRFRQEYPATPDEAFQMSGVSPFIRPEVVARCRRRWSDRGENIGPVVVGFDPAVDRDACGVIDRQTRVYGSRVCEKWRETDYESLTGRAARLIREINPRRFNVDTTGVGRPVADRLSAMGFECVRAVNFAQAATGVGPRPSNEYANRRAEMADSLRYHLETEECVLPDRDDLQMELCSPSWGRGATRYDGSGRLLLEPKAAIIERLGFSPDLFDACALTHAEAVADPVHAMAGPEPRACAVAHDPLYDDWS